MSYNALNIDDASTEPICYNKHVKYFVRFLNLLPGRLASHDTTRGSIAFFAVCGLDVLKSLNLLQPIGRQQIIDWIYGSLVTPREYEPQCGGFQGSRSVTVQTENEELLNNARCYQWGHLAMTYTSIGILVTLGDDLSRLDRKSVVSGVAAVQRPDGSFSACSDGSENDMRFVYCAAAVCHMLDYWGDVDKEKMFDYIINSIRYDNGISQHLEGESHGGTTFCALAALHLSGQLNRLSPKQIEGIKRWLLFRQIDGFQGRPNKPVDTCYSFWIGASLCILNAFDLIDYAENRKYILQTQDKIVGGFAKWPYSRTDPFHTYFGLCGLSFMKEPNLSEVMPSLNISMRAYKHLLSLHEKWLRENVNDLYVNIQSSKTVTPTNGNDDEQCTDSETSPLNKAQ